MIIDTNALSALAESDPAAAVRLSEAPIMAVSIVSLGEFSFGISGSKYRTKMEAWLARFLERVDVLYLDRQTLPFYAAIRLELEAAGTPIPANDCWIAALAKQHGMSILSRDRHFDRVAGLRRIDW